MNSAQVLRTSFGLTRAGIVSRHSNRAPGSNDWHWMHAWRSTPHFTQVLSEPIPLASIVPHRAHLKTSTKAIMFMTLGSMLPRLEPIKPVIHREGEPAVAEAAN